MKELYVNGWLGCHIDQNKDVGTPVVIPREPPVGPRPSASSSSSQPPNASRVHQIIPADQLGTQLHDIDGNVEATQNENGYVYIPSKHAPIGMGCGVWHIGLLNTF